MKKLGFLLASLILLSSCKTDSEHRQMLQQSYKTVYYVEQCRYIVIDSTNHVYDVRMNIDGGPYSKVEIR